MLLVDIINARASTCASTDKAMDGHLIAIEVGVIGHTNERVQLYRFPSIRIGSKAWIPNRWSVGARFNNTGVPE
jgi:hypothetical protein